MNITEKIYNYYPKVWDKIENYSYTISGQWETYRVYFMSYSQKKGIYLGFNKWSEIEIPFTFLYGLLEAFFEEYEIFIEVTRWASIDYPNVRHGYKIKDKLGHRLIDDNDNSKTKNEAKQQAILKACELLEAKL